MATATMSTKAEFRRNFEENLLSRAAWFLALPSEVLTDRKFQQKSPAGSILMLVSAIVAATIDKNI